MTPLEDFEQKDMVRSFNTPHGCHIDGELTVEGQELKLRPVRTRSVEGEKPRWLSPGWDRGGNKKSGWILDKI